MAQINDVQKGKPFRIFYDTKANIEGRSDLVAGMEAYATDTNLQGYYNGSSWIWGAGSQTYILDSQVRSWMGL